MSVGLAVNSEIRVVDKSAVEGNIPSFPGLERTPERVEERRLWEGEGEEEGRRERQLLGESHGPLVSTDVVH